jgi:glycosyltransferase involved in cell wall biosynthesis
VTLAVPCRNEERHLEACLRSLQAQEYPPERIEILVAEGRSTDASRRILARLAHEDPRIRVLDNPERIQAAGMNRLIRAARGELILRIDVHSDYAPSYVRACVETLERTGADNVGGAPVPRARTPFQRALCAALDSPLGVGGAPHRSATHEGFVDTVFLGAFRREVFDRIGLYDPRAVTNEDAELNQRLLAAGGRIYLSRAIEVGYFPRESFRALARQYFRYGAGRARTLLKHRRLPTLRPVLPFLGAVGGAVLTATSFLHPLTLPALGAYLFLCAIEAIRVGRRAGPTAIPLVAAIFPVLHLAHASGFAVGLARYLARPDWERPAIG